MGSSYLQRIMFLRLSWKWVDICLSFITLQSKEKQHTGYHYVSAGDRDDGLVTRKAER